MSPKITQKYKNMFFPKGYMSHKSWDHFSGENKTQDFGNTVLVKMTSQIVELRELSGWISEFGGNL